MKNEAFRVSCVMLLDDHRNALKTKEGEVADLRRETEGLHVVTTEEISWPKVDLCCEVKACSSREEELMRLREELGKMGSEML